MPNNRARSSTCRCLGKRVRSLSSNNGCSRNFCKFLKMKKLLAGAVLVLAVSADACAAAGTTDLPLTAAALIHRTGDDIVGCGVRVTGGKLVAGYRALWVDLSFNV